MGECAFFMQIPELAGSRILIVDSAHFLSEQRMYFLPFLRVVLSKVVKSPLVVLVQILLCIIFRMQKLAFAIVLKLQAILFVIAFNKLEHERFN
jgi:hypothetical protein